MNALETFLATVKRVEAITAAQYGEAAKARAVPVARVRAFASVDIRGYGDSKLDRDALSAMKAALAERAQAEGEAERDRQLTALAAELESIRADLPRQAARAAVELGAIARGLRP